MYWTQHAGNGVYGAEGTGVGFRKVLCDGLGKEQFKGMAESYTPVFDKFFPLDGLAPPSMDDAIYQCLSILKGSKAGKSSIDPNERELFKVQQKILVATKSLLFLATDSGASEQQRRRFQRLSWSGTLFMR